MSLFDDLPHQVSIYWPTVTQDASKGEVITWPAANLRAAGVPCLILQGPGGEANEFSQSQRPVSYHTIAFAGDNDGGVQPGDKLVDDVTGRAYRFTGDRPQQGVGGIDDFNFITVRDVN